MSVMVKSEGVAESVNQEIIASLVAGFSAIDDLPEWVVLAALRGEDVNGLPLKPTKSGKPPLQGSGELLDPSGFSLSQVSQSEISISRTLTFNAPDYYKYLIAKGYAFINENQLNPNVMEQVITALKRGAV